MIVTALLLGFAGSIHCVGMCSPLAMAVSNITGQAILGRLIYNAGRILTYALLGTIISSIGMHLPLNNFQNIISIVLGVLLITVTITGATTNYLPFIARPMQYASAKLKLLFARFLKRKTRTSVFILGALNGLLPCGLTFLALTYCITLSGPLSGFNFMVLFGLGTLPAMIGMTTLFHFLVQRFNISFKKVTTSMLLLSGCLLIARAFFFHLPHVMNDNGKLVDIILCK